MKPLPMKQQELFAFWKYDNFPHILGSEVIEIARNGLVEVKGYPGFLFEPVKILPLKEGREICTQLGELEEEYRNALINLTTDFNTRRKRILTFEGDK